jgi:uncharacterized protein YcbK (DUF882 family)
MSCTDPDCRAARGRRNFLRLGAAIVTSTLAAPVLAKAPSERILAFRNLHTGEFLRTAYWVDGSYDAASLDRIRHLLRDFRAHQVGPLVPGLLDLLWALQRRVESREPFHVISGYRSPKTNAMLRRLGHQVAARSLHMEGEAIDIRLPGRALRELHTAAVKLRAGGVGYYPRSGFIHVDVGRVRYWRGE